MTLKQLKYLLGVADSDLNITAAAERLYTSQSGISKQLKLLEEELGVHLFVRKAKSLVAITPAGREVIARSRKILRETENISRVARGLSDLEEGTLSIATTHTQARYVLPEIIASFRERFPHVNLELQQTTSDQIAELVSINRVDFAIAAESRNLFSDIVSLPCYQWNRIVLVPRQHPLARLTQPLDLETLAEYPLVTNDSALTNESAFQQAFHGHQLEPNVVFTARDFDVIKTYVRRGLGVGVVAAMAYERSDSKDLKALDASALFPTATTWLGFRRETVMPSFMVDFAISFAPHLTVELITAARSSVTQADVDALFEGIHLPIRGGYENKLVSVA